MSDNMLEIIRKGTYAKYKITFFLCGGFCLVSLIIGGYNGINQDNYSFLEWGLLTLFITALLTVIFYCCCYFLLIKRAYERFLTAYKNFYVLPLVSGLGEFQNLEYVPENGLSFEELTDMLVVNCGVKTHFSSDDMLTGCYRNLRFLICNAATGRTGKTGKIYTSDTIFHGQIIRFEHIPAFMENRGLLQIFDNKYVSGFQGRLAKYRIEAGDPEFDGRFQVYAADPDHTPLTPQLIEKIKAFADRSEKWIAITIYGPSATMAVHRSRRLFDVWVDKPINNQKQEILKDVKLLQSAADIFS